MLRFSYSNDASNRHAGRREWLRIGGLAGISWAFPGLIPARAADVSLPQQMPGFGRAKSVIIVFASGGQSQLDTWDPKPEAPSEIRGEFRSIGTSVPGVRFCEHMPQIAKVADRLCIVRNMAHEDLDHGSALYLAMTGRYHRRRSGNPLPSPEDMPCFGSILHRVRPAVQFAQTAVHLNGPAEVPFLIAPGQNGGMLGKSCDPLVLGDVTKGTNAVPTLIPHSDVPEVRMRSRQSLLTAVEGMMSKDIPAGLVQDKQALYSQAFDLLSRDNTRRAFDLSEEPDQLRDRYGRNRSGQACLLARRLVEAGVPLVTVIWSHSNRGQDVEPQNTDLYGWDTHNDIFDGLKNHLLPRFDQGYSALIEDLDARGMLEDTLVVCMGEFGRAPLVALEPRFAGLTPGRKHWSSVYSIALAGAGIAPGTVVGESDSRGAYPRSEPWGPWDVMATVFSSLGIDPGLEYRDPVNRPFRICEGRVITPAYAT
ncbi:MAG: DUF1501 domain-containing protein [Planctomyces sp.]|nr:DUF1501 domain-containing protein [Planctomyces sp.]